MSNRFFGRSLLAGWFAGVAILVLWSMAVDAKLSTSLLFLALGVGPVFVSLLIESGAPPPDRGRVVVRREHQGP
jgi:hypothetical protein